MSLPKPSSTEILYQLLILLQVLEPIREERSGFGSGGHIKLNHSNVRRSFVEAIAYISAYRSGRDHVTATAIRQTPARGIIWLASNKRVEKKVTDFLISVLQVLGDFARLEHSKAIIERPSITEGLLQGIIKFVTPRLRRYHSKAVNILPECLRVIKVALSQGEPSKAFIPLYKFR